MIDKKKKGRPFGTTKTYRMKNGYYKPEDVYLYTPEDTIPKDELNRFLRLCDEMIVLLDPRTINKAEVEEIAKVYRESIIIDSVYREFAKEGSALDPTMVNSLDKIVKAVEKRKENLAIRASDRQESRNFNKQLTLMDVISEVGSDVEKMEQEEKEIKNRLEQTNNNLSKVTEFIDDKEIS